MYLNVAPRQPAARQPRFLVKVNDTPLLGAIDFEVDNNNYYAADTFRLTLAVSRLPAAFNAAWWALQSTDIFIEIFAGFPANPDNPQFSELQSLIYARVDDVSFDPVSTTIIISGRDMTAAMIDAKTTAKWEQLTSSQIAIQLALSHNLNPVVTATSGIVGDYYKAVHVQLPDIRSEWDLITSLAANENFVVYVNGRDLHFEPKPDESKKDVYAIYWDPPTATRAYALSNVLNINFQRSMTVGRGIQVVVKSWNQKQKKGFTTGYPSKSKGIQAGKASPFGGVQTYSFVLANVTQEQATQFAQRKYKELIQHEMIMSVTMPADNALSVTSAIQVSGTGTAFDQLYFPDSIKRSMSKNEGYLMNIRAKNHAPDSVPLA